MATPPEVADDSYLIIIMIIIITIIILHHRADDYNHMAMQGLFSWAYMKGATRRLRQLVGLPTRVWSSAPM